MRSALRVAGWAAVDRAARYRWIVVPLFAALMTVIGLARTLCDGDTQSFANLGRLLLSGQLSRVYAGFGNQAGPLELVWNAVATLGSPNCAYEAWELPGAVCVAVVVAASAMGGVGVLVNGSEPHIRARLQFSVGLVSVMTLCAWTARWGHPADVIIPALWMFACWAGQQGRWRSAAVALGVACGWETWAVLGAAILIVLGWRRAVHAAALAAAVAACFYLPFVLTGSFAMFDMTWTVWPESLIGVLTGQHHLTWGMRMTQTVLVSGVAAAVAYRLRDSKHLVWAVPLTVACTRLCTDPALWDYYWGIATVPALSGLAVLCASAERSRHRTLTISALSVLLLPHPAPPWSYIQIAGCVVLLLVAARGLGSPAPSELAGRSEPE